MATEEAFDISIADEEAWEIRTVGQLEDLVLAKLHVQDASKHTRPYCLSSFSFYRFRAALQKHAGIPRRSITPTTHLEDVLPSDNRQALWLRLGQELDWKLPALEHPAWLNYSFTTLFVSIVFAALGLHIPGKLVVELCVFFGLMAIPLLALAYRRTAPLVTKQPSPSLTVRGLVEGVLSMNFGRIKSQHEAQLKGKQAWRTDEVLQMVRRIIAEQLDVELAEVIPSARFIEDLHMD
ncbi:hypothetical protein [Uliginosibacterium gangwonense]|uniref:hypothetical protein n=1 Tax=Uliginosibacterium gangwonense TaxID=392736 RepID=UPI001B7FADDC